MYDVSFTLFIMLIVSTILHINCKVQQDCIQLICSSPIHRARFKGVKAS